MPKSSQILDWLTVSKIMYHLISSGDPLQFINDYQPSKDGGCIVCCKWFGWSPIDLYLVLIPNELVTMYCIVFSFRRSFCVEMERSGLSLPCSDLYHYLVHLCIITLLTFVLLPCWRLQKNFCSWFLMLLSWSGLHVWTMWDKEIISHADQSTFKLLHQSSFKPSLSFIVPHPFSLLPSVVSGAFVQHQPAGWPLCYSLRSPHLVSEPY